MALVDRWENGQIMYRLPTSKVNFHHRAPLCKYNEPLLHFDHVNVDLVGPLPPSKGFTHLLTVVDRVTRWPEAIPLASTNTKDVAEAFLSGWITHYGLPSDVSLTEDPSSRPYSGKISLISSGPSCTTLWLTIPRQTALWSSSIEA